MAPASATRVWDDPADAKPTAPERRRERAAAAYDNAPHPQTAYPVAAPSGNGRTFSFLCFVSLLLCAASSYGWARSYWAKDVYTFPDAGGREHVVYSEHGDVNWIAPAPDGRERFVKIPYWLPVGLTAIPPIAWLFRRRSRAQDA
jgi:hypothetical protein